MRKPDDRWMNQAPKWEDFRSPPVDHDKRDAWFIVACGVWLVMVGAACWALGNL